MASSASVSDGTRQVTSPATPIGSRLVASSANAGQATRRASNQRRACIEQQMLAVVQRREHPTVADQARKGVHRRAAPCGIFRRGAEGRDPSVSADVLFNESGQPVFDGGDGSRAVLVVLFVAQQGGQSGGVGELLHRRCDFADGEVVVIVDG